jgi:hypothetical protein
VRGKGRGKGFKRILAVLRFLGRGEVQTWRLMSWCNSAPIEGPTLLALHRQEAGPDDAGCCVTTEIVDGVCRVSLQVISTMLWLCLIGRFRSHGVS